MALSTVLDACSEVNGPYVDVPWIASYSPIGTGGYHRFVTPLRFPCVVVVAPVAPVLVGRRPTLILRHCASVALFEPSSVVSD